MSKKYSVRSLPTADADMDDLEQFIVEQCAALLTAARQFQLLFKLFDWLEEYAELPAVHVPLSGNLIGRAPHRKAGAASGTGGLRGEPGGGIHFRIWAVRCHFEDSVLQVGSAGNQG